MLAKARSRLVMNDKRITRIFGLILGGLFAGGLFLNALTF
jgi:hypothetical protein